MRIITGMARGLPLAGPRGGDTRPTSDRVREAVFSSLGGRVVAATVLDLFAGTGALGLEAASRGARSVTFVEKARSALGILEKNLAAFKRAPGVACELEVVRGAVEHVTWPGTFTLILADPPYAHDPVALLELIRHRGWLAGDGRLVLETAKRVAWELPSGWLREREAVYGDTRVTTLVAVR
jgi:16S rRNA (guanine(966)-N(2))-methyltransferase RsmD